MKFARRVENIIADFRGLPRDDSRSIDRGAKSLGSAVEVCFDRYKIDQETPHEIILSHWSRIVGPRFAQRCQPERIDRSGMLLINVNNSILRRELQFMEDRILTALRSIKGCENINGIVLKAG